MLGVLTGGTLLTSQMQAELAGNVDKRVAETQLAPPDEAIPLKLNDFKLPKNTLLSLPKGANISPDFTKLQLPKDIDLELPNDLDLSGLDFELPEDFNLQLPAGSIFSPPGLDLPNGGSFKLPDGTELRLPPGSKLDLPPELVQRLLNQGLGVGVLAAAAALTINDLPPDLLASLDPPSFTGGGRLSLPGGTTITLPDGQQFPFGPGELPNNRAFTLPAGTTFDIPAPEGGGRVELPVPRPERPTQLEKPPTEKQPTKIAVDTEITGMPTRVRKGDPITVSGYVREATTGRAVAGAPVDIFMNETKRLPGVHVGSGISDSSGTFRITITLPSDKPARDYQLVNHASAFRDAQGREYADGWGDPPFATYAATTLRLSVPARDGLGTTTTITGHLLDHTGTPVSGATVVLTIGTTTIGRPVTNAAGRFDIQHRFGAGTHVVDARFAGNGNYEASTARGTITIDDFAIELATPSHHGKPGDSFLLSGRTLGRGAVAPERTVTITTPFANPVSVISDSAGRFTHVLAVPREQSPGSYAITYSLAEFNITKTQMIDLNLTAGLTITAPALWDVEVEMPTTIGLRTADGRALPNQSVRVSLAGPGGTRDLTLTTDSFGLIIIELTPLRVAPGDYTLSAQVLGNPHLIVPPVARAVRLGAFEVAWSIPDTIIRGQKATGSLTATFDGRPLAGQHLALDGFVTRDIVTDTRGRASWDLVLSPATPLGNATLTVETADHPPRSAKTNVIALPKLNLDVPEAFTTGEPIVPTLTLTDDVGVPLRDAPVTLVVGAPEGIQRTTVRTDRDGKWSGPLNVTNSVGNVTLSARYDPAGTFLGAESVRAMSATAPVAPKTPFSLPSWAIPLAVGTVLAGATAAGAAWYIRKRPPTRRVPVAAATAAPLTMSIATDFSIAFGIPEDEPAVWGVGDPLELVIENYGPQGEFRLSWEGGSVNLYLPSGAREATTLTFPTEGAITLTAHRVGLDAMPPATAHVAIVDYRKETAREFDLFIDAARSVESSITRQSTPREIGWLLGPRLPPEAQEPLDELASVMEVTNYSHYSVARAHYLRFVRATAALTPILTPPPPAQPPTPADAGG